MDKKTKIRNLILAAVGVISLLSEYYSGPLKTFIVKYGASIAFPFGLYFLLQFFRLPKIENRIINAFYTFVLVLILELLQAAGLFGVFDWADFIFYLIGIVIAVVIDVKTLKTRKSAEK